MKLTESNFIYKKLDTLNDKVVSREKILNIIKLVDNKTHIKKLETLRKTKKIQYIFLNYYYITSENERKQGFNKYSSEEMVLSVLNKLKVKWHFGFDTALERKKLVWQVSKTIVILNDSISKKIIIRKTPFSFIKTKNRYIIDYTTIKTKNRISTYYPSKEKLFLDYIYFNKKVPIELKNNVNKVRLDKIISNYPIMVQNKVKNEI